MAQKSSFFNSVGGDRKYNASDYANYFKSFIGNGIYPVPSSNLFVGEDANMDLLISEGKAWINGYYYENTSPLSITIDISDGVLKRIDLIVLKLDHINREIVVSVKKGIPSAVPVAPTLERSADAYELGLASVSITNGAIEITQANITDLRFDNSFCGIVKGVVDQVDASSLFAQYDQIFNDWFQGLEDLFDENIAANMLNLINQNETKIETMETQMITHIDGQMPHHFTDGGVTYRYGWQVVDGNLQFVYEEVL